MAGYKKKNRHKRLTATPLSQKGKESPTSTEQEKKQNVKEREKNHFEIFTQKFFLRSWNGHMIDYQMVQNVFTKFTCH